MPAQHAQTLGLILSTRTITRPLKLDVTQKDQEGIQRAPFTTGQISGYLTKAAHFGIFIFLCQFFMFTQENT